jgi:hypothetical protein
MVFFRVFAVFLLGALSLGRGTVARCCFGSFFGLEVAKDLKWLVNSLVRS